MAHEHGDHGHQPHGGAGDLGWSLLDSIMMACAMFIGYFAAELAYKAWKAQSEVRYDLTPEGLAAAGPEPVEETQP